MNEQDQARFEGWAIVEVMGHRTIAGYVTTKYFGPSAMVHIVQPEVPAQEQVLTKSQYVGGEWCEPGTRIRISREKAEAYVGAGSIYQLTPCTEKAALERQPEHTEIVERVERKAIAASDDDGDLKPATKPQVEELYRRIAKAELSDDDDYECGVRDALGWCLGQCPQPEIEIEEEDEVPY